MYCYVHILLNLCVCVFMCVCVCVCAGLPGQVISCKGLVEVKHLCYQADTHTDTHTPDKWYIICQFFAVVHQQQLNSEQRTAQDRILV